MKDHSVNHEALMSATSIGDASLGGGGGDGDDGKSPSCVVFYNTEQYSIQTHCCVQ